MIKEYALVPTSPTKMIDLQRAEAGVKKYFEDTSRGILIGGIWNGDSSTGYSNSQSSLMYNHIRKLGVPRQPIDFENQSRTTLENVFYACSFFVNNRAESAIICTDSDHAARFRMLFDRAKGSRILPRAFNIEFFTEGIDKAYPWWKAQAAYIHDLTTTLSGIHID